MRAHLAASMIVTVWALLTLLRLASAATKPIQIVNLSPRIGMAGTDITFLVRLTPEADDRELSALLCDLNDPPCTLERHERIDSHGIEGTDTPKLWSPTPFAHVEAGEYAVVAAIGPRGAIRASAAETVTLVER